MKETGTSEPSGTAKSAEPKTEETDTSADSAKPSERVPSTLQFGISEPGVSPFDWED